MNRLILGILFLSAAAFGRDVEVFLTAPEAITRYHTNFVQLHVWYSDGSKYHTQLFHKEELAKGKTSKPIQLKDDANITQCEFTWLLTETSLNQRSSELLFPRESGGFVKDDCFFQNPNEIHVDLGEYEVVDRKVSIQENAFKRRRAESVYLFFKVVGENDIYTQTRGRFDRPGQALKHTRILVREPVTHAATALWLIEDGSKNTEQLTFKGADLVIE